MESIFNKATRSDLFNVDPRCISVISDFNPREDYGDIEELSKSIAENGVKVPLSGYKKIIDGEEKWFLTDGHRRLKATLLAIDNGYEIARVPFKIENKTYTESERLCDTVLKNDGKRLTQYEEAKVYDRLINKFNWTSHDVAKKFAKKQSYICNTIALLTMPEEIKKEVALNAISAQTAMNIVRTIDNEERAVEVVKTAINDAKMNGKKKATDKNVKAKELIERNNLAYIKKGIQGLLISLDENNKIDNSFYNKLIELNVGLSEDKTLSEVINDLF